MAETNSSPQLEEFDLDSQGELEPPQLEEFNLDPQGELDFEEELVEVQESTGSQVSW